MRKEWRGDQIDFHMLGKQGNHWRSELCISAHDSGIKMNFKPQDSEFVKIKFTMSDRTLQIIMSQII